jgi:hypothetical protein
MQAFMENAPTWFLVIVASIGFTALIILLA